MQRNIILFPSYYYYYYHYYRFIVNLTSGVSQKKFGQGNLTTLNDRALTLFVESTTNYILRHRFLIHVVICITESCLFSIQPPEGLKILTLFFENIFPDSWTRLTILYNADGDLFKYFTILA